jgi:uncharacterized protein (DUF736 family)
MGAASKSRKERIMATIGTFTRENDAYQGRISTLMLQLPDVRIVPDGTGSANAPTHRVFSGSIEIGAAWAKQSGEGRSYISVKLDDPSLPAAIFANLFEDDGAETHSLIWSRPRRSRAE